MKRDLTKDQFEYRLTKLGFKKKGFMGYWELPGCTTSVSAWNAGKRRRDQIKYLVREEKRLRARTGAVAPAPDSENDEAQPLGMARQNFEGKANE